MMKIYDARFSLPDAKEIMNLHGVGNYSFKRIGNDKYLLIIGENFCQIGLEFSIEMEKGVLHWNYGAATMREILENEEMANRLVEHLFVKIGNEKIDLLEDQMPIEIRISNSHTTYDPTDMPDLEFDMGIGFGGNYFEKVLHFTIIHSKKLCIVNYLYEDYKISL